MTDAAIATRSKRNFKAALTLSGLKALPEPVAIGPRHKPVSHYTVVKALEDKLQSDSVFGLPIIGQKWELNEDYQRLFGTIDLGTPNRMEAQREALIASRATEYTGIDRSKVDAILQKAGLGGAAGMTLSVRNSHDQSYSLQIGLSLRVFVCNNLAMDTISAIRVMRKHTGDEPWDARIEELLGRVLLGGEGFVDRIMAMRDTKLSDTEAKALIYDAFTSFDYNPLPASHFPKVGEVYFGHKTEDVQDQTRWALHNSFTRVMRELPIRRQQESSAKITELLSRDLLAVEVTQPDVN